MTERHSRRYVLAAVGVSAVSALAGCSDDDTDHRGGGPRGDVDDHHRDDVDDHRDGFDHHRDGFDGGRHHGEGRLGPVPAVYETATAVDGTVRDPDSLASKRAVDYQSVPENGDQCAGCRYYIPDKDGDGLGACAIVAGVIEPDGWCRSFVPAD